MQTTSYSTSHIVADAQICHGQLTFRGTRILVADVLEQVSQGMDWQAISEAWRGKVSPDAVAEAVRLANHTFTRHMDEIVSELEDTRVAA